MGIFSPLPEELTRASETSNTGSIIDKLSLKPPVNSVRVRVFLKEKMNDHSLLVLQPGVKNPNVERR
jgi:hypothetical protein